MSDHSPPPASLDLNRLRVVASLGRGAKGAVFLVDTGAETLALKAISRSSIEKKSRISNGSSESAYRRIWFEHDVLSALDHPLLPKLRGSISTDRIVGFAMDFCSGGDLSSLRRRQTEKMFSDEVIRFYAAELVLALDYLHKSGIVYRDLKPENVLIQENGHLMLVDFDLSTRLPPKKLQKPDEKNAKKPPAKTSTQKRLQSYCFLCDSGISPDEPDPVPDRSDKSNSFVGTEEYVAPEIIRADGHDFSADWWSLGVVLYEMLYGRTPFRGQTRKETFYRILNVDPDLVGEPNPLRDLIRGLLEKDPRRRVSGGVIMGHEFFRGVDWERILRVDRPPFVPGAFREGEDDDVVDLEGVVLSVFGGGSADVDGLSIFAVP
ncbi:Serine/threonine-protein kinase OXI1 [Acorus gramineus]|uniref:non-specific serine/threonine protein kinase n=1 Tax=Acorus gramineus TaxID=55184 RepID=A0AAV9B4H9_ACOGR|nr:Serine/threonine-protein kinase OXI1 [Acorus gramineus]